MAATCYVGSDGVVTGNHDDGVAAATLKRGGIEATG
jgi:hypothetical protein